MALHASRARGSATLSATMTSTRAKAVPKKALLPKARASNVGELRAPSERLRALEEAIEAVEKSYGDALEDHRTGPILVSPDALDIAREAVALRRWPALQAEGIGT